MEFHPSQKEVARDRHRFRVLRCGRRWGKTTLAIDQIKALAGSRPVKIAYIAPTYQQARDICWAELRRDLNNVAEFNEARLEIKLINGSLILLRGWESVETLRGQAFDLIVLDEVAMMRNFWLNWQEVIRPTLTDHKGEALFISTPKGYNHFYDLCNLELADDDFKTFHFKTSDNPHIPYEEIQKAEQQLTPERFAQEYEASFEKTEGLVYKEFSRKLHIFTTWPSSPVLTMVGVDFGTHNPAAVIKVQKDKYGVFYASEELYKTGLTDAQVADYVANLKVNRCYPDPESASGVLELQRRGVNVREVRKGKDSVRNGINAVRELLKSNRLLIHKTSLNLIFEFETYVYPEAKDGLNEYENPIKSNDHALDALRYALMMEQYDTSEDIALRQFQQFDRNNHLQDLNSTR